MLAHAWIIPLIPAVSFLAILAFGKRLPRGGSEIGIASVALCFVLALAVGVGWMDRVDNPPEAHHAQTEQVADTGEEHAALTGDAASIQFAAAPGTSSAAPAAADEEVHETVPVVRQITWFESDGLDMKVGTMVDGLSTLMLVVVTLISLLVHIFSTDYVAGDRRYTHYFAFLSLFTASMLFFVLSSSTLQMIVGWELVGLCSFALIGHWWEEKPNSDAALKAFLTNRVGDVGLLCGMIILFFAADRSFDVIQINEMAAAGEIRHFLLLVASLSLMAAVMSKSGQFILHTWLPDAMAGPTPVSALIHAATMVVAGIYMIARLYPVFYDGLSIGTANINAMALIGSITLLFGGLLAFVQDDIKKVLAYSTVSQLGYMVMALGVGAWTAAIFHLFTHALFKACLFLGAGSLAHHIHSFDMKKDMGGLRKVMPKTFWTFMIGTAALVAVPPLAGFWSKDEILAGAQQLGGDGGYPLMLIMGTLGAAVTGAYMTRAIWYCFFGERRGASATHDMHENGPRITVPLIVLAVGAVFAGFTNIPNTGALSGLPDGITMRFEHYVEPKAAYFVNNIDTFTHADFNIVLAVVSTLIGLAGVALAYLWFWKGLGPHGITERNRFARTGYMVLERKYGLDILYTDIIAGSTKGPIARAAYWINQKVIDGTVDLVGNTSRRVGRWTYRYIDQGAVDGAVNRSGLAASASGGVFAKAQTGKVQAYGAYLFLGAAVLAAVIVVIAS